MKDAIIKLQAENGLDTTGELNQQIIKIIQAQ